MVELFMHHGINWNHYFWAERIGSTLIIQRHLARGGTARRRPDDPIIGAKLVTWYAGLDIAAYRAHGIRVPHTYVQIHGTPGYFTIANGIDGDLVPIR